MDVEDGMLNIEYKGLVLDEDGLPMIPDNIHLIKAVIAYVKIQHYEIKYALGELPGPILQRAEREYSWNVAVAETAFKMPSEDEMESIRNGLVRFISNYRANSERFEYEHLNRVNP